MPLNELWKTGEGKLLYRAMIRSQHLKLAISPRLFGFQGIMTRTADAVLGVLYQVLIPIGISNQSMLIKGNRSTTALATHQPATRRASP